MNRRTYLTLTAVSLIPLSGCVVKLPDQQSAGGEQSDSTDDTNAQSTSADSESKGSESTDAQTQTENTHTVEGEFLPNESDSNTILHDHKWRSAKGTTSEWGVAGTVSQSSGERADIEVSVNFIDEENVVVSDSNDYLTEIANEQKSEFFVEYHGYDHTDVSTYEIFVETHR